jgi:hypothetical protein
MVQLHQKTNTVPEVLVEYQKLQDLMGKRDELLVGMAHAYFSEKQFLKAGPLYE